MTSWELISDSADGNPHSVMAVIRIGLGKRLLELVRKHHHAVVHRPR